MNFRYVFLAFGFEERVVADKASCQLLLERMKLDGWAVGHTKVFLKYYHVEYLAKLYEQQVKRIIQVQIAIRRWLARVRRTKVPPVQSPRNSIPPHNYHIQNNPHKFN